MRFILMKRVHDRKTIEQCQGNLQGSRIAGKGIIEQVRKKDVVVLITRAHRPSTTDIDNYRREEASFPQGQWKSALLGQENTIMSSHEHGNDAATAGFAL